jgi:glutamate formiminotransferase/formiminotetrahydrofolate cyclodeaminase
MTSHPLIECVPNFSEGRDAEVIKQVTAAIESVEGVRLLDVDMGHATHRTVVTFVGTPQAVVEAAVRAGRKASELIDMSRHQGAHPRFGAMDVCPLVPVAHITMAQTVTWARELARRLGEEAGLTVYCYEHAASSPQRRNLAAVRAGEYEGLAEKLSRPEWAPDFGPARFNARSGATAVGARNFLVAYNVNLNTTSTRRANAIAYDIREKGRIKTRDGTPDGEPVLDERGEKVWTPGTLKCVKAIGWFIEEYGIAQISINLTDITVTPVHVAFDEVCRRAEARGVRVTGSELVGLIPLQAMLDAGRYFLKKQHRSTGVSDRELIKIAVKSLGLDDLHSFKPEEKIIEYRLVDRASRRLVDMALGDFVERTASEAPAPGGGSVAAALGALGAALATMVANLSSHKRGWDERWEEFSNWAEQGKQHSATLLRLIDEDTDAFNALMATFGLPKTTPAEAESRRAAIQAATRQAIEVPLEVMRCAASSMKVIARMADIGLPSSISDAGVAALAARAAVMGAFLNVKINCGSFADKAAVRKILDEGLQLQDQALTMERDILDTVNGKLSPGAASSSGT